MKAVWRKGTLLGVLATAALTVGCAGKGTRELEEQNRTLQAACDDLRRRNESLEKENAAYKAERPIRDAYVDKLEKEAALARRIQELMKQERIGGITMRGDVFELESDFFFRPGSDDISREGVESIRKVAAILKSGDAYVRVIGHTDNDPINKSKKENPTGMNLELGARRAVSVANEMRKAGIDETRMHVISMGEADPVVSNDSKESKKRNRRVDIMYSATPPAWSVKAAAEEKPSPRKRQEEPTK